MTEAILAHEMVIRGTVFFGLLIAVALWEAAAPCRNQLYSRWQRWPNNLGIIVLGSLLLRLVFPVAAVATAALAQQNGWGLFNRLDLPAGVTIVLAVIAFYPIFVLTADKPVDWVRSLLVAVIVLLVGIGMFAYKLIGGGDAKLIAAAALWAGPAHITPLLMTTAIGGGLLCVFAVSPLRTFLPYLAAAAKLDADMAHLMKLHIPYGVAIAAGGLFVAARLF